MLDKSVAKFLFDGRIYAPGMNVRVTRNGETATGKIETVDLRITEDEVSASYEVRCVGAAEDDALVEEVQHEEIAVLPPAPVRSRPVKTRASEQHAVDGFNDLFAVGTPVRYWTGAREGEGRISKTRSEAELLGGHTAVVWIEGVRGCVALSHVEVIDPVEEALPLGAKEESPL